MSVVGWGLKMIIWNELWPQVFNKIFYVKSGANAKTRNINI